MNLPAKLRRPKSDASRILARERLYRLLDDASGHACTWISGPPGAGKTALVESWLRERGLRSLWYHVDASDADPAVLPYYLHSVAGQMFAGLTAKLPLLTPDRQGSLKAFASDFFSPLFDALSEAPKTAHRNTAKRRSFVLVIDDFSEGVTSAAFVELVAAAALCAQAPAMRVVVLAREQPCGPFPRLHAVGSLAVIGGEQLRLTPDETRCVAAMYRRSGTPWSEQELLQVHRWCDGWVAGLALVSAATDASNLPDLSTVSREKIFPYLAEEILRAQSTTVRRLLITCALLPVFTAAMAEALSETAYAAKVLERMVQGNLLTSVRLRAGGEAGVALEPGSEVYEFHALLRAYLLAQGRLEFEPAVRRALLVRAAALLASDGQVESAVSALAEAQEYALLAALIRAHAGDLLHAGRMQTLAQWLAALPRTLLEADPWLLYWQGACEVLFDPVAGRAALTRAFASFQAGADPEGTYLAWCSIVESISLEWRDFSEFDPWIAQGDRLRLEQPNAGSPALETRFVCGMLNALMWRLPGRPEVPHWYQQAKEAVSRVDHDGLRLAAGISLFHYAAVHWGNHRELDQVYAVLRPRQTQEPLSPIEAIMTALIDAGFAWLRGDPDLAVKLVHEGCRLREHYGVQALGYLLRAQEIYALATSGRIDEAAAVLTQARASELDSLRQVDFAHWHYQEALIRFHYRQLPEALESVQLANSIAVRAGGPHQCTLGALAKAEILHAMGDTPMARRLVAEGMDLQQGAQCDIMEWKAQLCLALFALDEGLSAECAGHLRTAFAIGARNDILNYTWFLPAMMARLCAQALQLDIESAYALRLIDRRALKPPFALEAWPLPIKIYCAAGFEVRVRGRPLQARRKKLDAPLRLLRGLVELAAQDDARTVNDHDLPRRPVDRAALGRHLRPTADAVTTERWIDQNLRRLRKRLGHDDAVESSAGMLTLNPQRIWVDVFGEGGGVD